MSDPSATVSFDTAGNCTLEIDATTMTMFFEILKAYSETANVRAHAFARLSPRERLLPVNAGDRKAALYLKHLMALNKALQAANEAIQTRAFLAKPVCRHAKTWSDTRGGTRCLDCSALLVKP